jgi:type 1 fimbriae regulatory protein FimB
MKSLTKSELAALLAVARKHNERDYWMILVTWNHGLRVSEMLSLRRENFRAGRLTVQRLKGSKKTSQPTLLLEIAETRDAFAAFVASCDDLLFPTNRMDVWRKMQKYGAEAGIPEEKRHPHALKHTCGRLAYEAGVGIAEIQTHLGHVNGKNALIYMESTEEQASAVFTQAFAAAAGAAA